MAFPLGSFDRSFTEEPPDDLRGWTRSIETSREMSDLLIGEVLFLLLRILMDCFLFLRNFRKSWMDFFSMNPKRPTSPQPIRLSTNSRIAAVRPLSQKLPIRRSFMDMPTTKLYKSHIYIITTFLIPLIQVTYLTSTSK